MYILDSIISKINEKTPQNLTTHRITPIFLKSQKKGETLLGTFQSTSSSTKMP